MLRVHRVVAACCTALLLASCGILHRPEGEAETDQESATLADAIIYPHQENAAGFARAALAAMGHDHFSVLEATDLRPDSPTAPIARLVWRIHRDRTQRGYDVQSPFDACYSVEFNHDEVTAGPTRITCPANAVAITPPPLPDRHIPQSYGPALKTILGKLPAHPTEDEVRTALSTGLLIPHVDPKTGVASIPPQAVVLVRGSDVGVALIAGIHFESRECMLGQRADGRVAVWSLNDRDMRMEKPCTPQAALAPR